MQTKPGVAVPVTEDDAFSTRVPIKVCMHVIQRARTDARILRDATALVEAGCTVTIVDVESDRTRPPEEDMAGIHVKHIFMPSLFVPARFKPWFLVKLLLVVMRGAMQLVKVQADIYHAHVEKALPACYIATCLLRRPLIFDAPDLTLSDPTIMRRRTLRLLSARLLAHMVSRCAAVITASPYYVSELRTLYRAPDITVVRNVPVYRAVSRNERLRQRLGLGSEISIALYQGGIQPNRCLDRLVSAAKFLAPNIVIVIMGEDLVPARSQLEALIASEQVVDRVKLLPPVPYTELLEWTASADIGLTIFPPEYSLSIRFTLPNKLFEYLMAGLPVLSSQLDAVAEVIHTYDVGQVAPSLAPADLGGAISAMLNDKAALQRMGSNALQTAQKEFYWEKESQSLVGLYHTILMPSMEYKAAVLPN